MVPSFECFYKLSCRCWLIAILNYGFCWVEIPSYNLKFKYLTINQYRLKNRFEKVPPNEAFDNQCGVNLTRFRRPTNVGNCKFLWMRSNDERSGRMQSCNYVVLSRITVQPNAAFVFENRMKTECWCSVAPNVVCSLAIMRCWAERKERMPTRYYSTAECSFCVWKPNVDAVLRLTWIDVCSLAIWRTNANEDITVQPNAAFVFENRMLMQCCA